ncbi:MAG: S9 family peptidase [Xanthomonadaceae bacterium]|nr:S9 family peptidase [Xanthomonadaceae bacterium]MDZ4115777.1 S9 family peptidase [Xanthomonadaceae bacterium]
MRYLIIFLFALLLSFTVAAEKQIPLEDFLKDDAFGTIEISPNGDYLAATVPMEDRTSLIILRLSDMSKTGHVTLPKNTHIAGFDWVNDERILFSIGEKQGSLEQPRGTGELYGVNADGSGQGAALIGARAKAAKYATAQKTKFVIANIIHLLPDDPKFVLISVAEFGGEFTSVERLNVETGRRLAVARAPVRNAQFLADPKGVVRFALGAGSDLKSKTYYRDGEGREWQLINDEAVTGIVVGIIGFNADATTAYLQVEQEQGPDAIEAFDTKSGQRKLVMRDDVVDPAGALVSPVDGGVWGVVFNGTTPRVEYIDQDSPFAAAHRSLSAALPGQMVLPTGFTRDGRIGLFRAYSDRVPMDFYLFDRKAGSARYLASRVGWFKPEELAASKPVVVRSRDGLSLHGLLTLPNGSDGKKLPLIVNPHGGPFGPYDAMGFDLDAQVLASRGYAVLKVNFRGSGNYGSAFQRAGYKQWGGTMQDDLTDATHWAIEQGIADPKRICIYGASYGAYAALMGVTKEPDLYACAAGNVGVYDMPTMYGKGDVQARRAGENFLKETLGEENLEAISPTRLADRIKVPVLLAAGAEDERAPPIHTEMMRDALERLNKPVETVIYKGEGHGSYLLKNRLDGYQRLLAFFDRNIGAGMRTSAASADTAGN